MACGYLKIICEKNGMDKTQNVRHSLVFLIQSPALVFLNLSFCLHKETRIVRKAKTGRGVGGRVGAISERENISGICMAIQYFFAFLHERHIGFNLFFFKLDAKFVDFEWVDVLLGITKETLLFTWRDIKVGCEK